MNGIAAESFFDFNSNAGVFVRQRAALGLPASEVTIKKISPEICTKIPQNSPTATIYR